MLPPKGGRQGRHYRNGRRLSGEKKGWKRGAGSGMIGLPVMTELGVCRSPAKPALVAPGKVVR